MLERTFLPIKLLAPKESCPRVFVLSLSSAFTQAASLRLSSRVTSGGRSRQRGTIKAPLHRAQELRVRGLTVPEITTALGVSRRTAFRYLATAPAS